MTMNVTARHHHPMSDRLDPAPYAEQARQLRALASRARAAYEEKLVDDGARLGLERDKAARAKSAAEQELAAAKLQSKRELGVADQADKAAAALERRATQTKGTAGEELREQAAEQRARAEIARRRAHAADDDAESLQFTVGRHHQTVELLETQMKSNDDMKYASSARSTTSRPMPTSPRARRERRCAPTSCSSVSLTPQREATRCS